MPRYYVYIWDLSSNGVRKINDFTDLWLWHVNANDDILVAFEVNRST